MATTNFVNGTIVEADWLNDVDESVYQYADVPIARANRLVVGYDDDADVSNNTTALENNSMLIRYSTAYSNAVTKSALHSQRFIAADTGANINSHFKTTTILGATDGSTTPVEGVYRNQWDVNVEHDNYSTKDDAGVSVGVSSTIRRYSDQGVIGLHINCMDMRVPPDANNTAFGGITGIEAHSDGIGPDVRQGAGDNYGYRQTVRLAARTQRTIPTWDLRGSGAMINSAAIARDEICLPKNASLVESYTDAYFVCTTAGTLGVVDTILDATTTPGTTVIDGTAVWECRRGAEIGCALKIINGDSTGVGSTPMGYYRFGIIIDADQSNDNPNEIETGIYIKNYGTYNYRSYGDPTFHGHYKGIDVAADLVLALENAGTSTTLGTLSFRGDSDTGAERSFANISGASVDITDGSYDGRILISATVASVGQPHAYFEGLNTIIGAKSVLDTTATAGFLHVGRCAGAPTGVPDLYTGKCPMVVDSTNGRLYVYHSGGWHYATLT